MKSGSDATPLRHGHVRADDVTVECSSSPGVEAHEIAERGRTRNMVSKFEAGSKVNVCRSGSRTFANSHAENIQKVRPRHCMSALAALQYNRYGKGGGRRLPQLSEFEKCFKTIYYMLQKAVRNRLMPRAARYPVFYGSSRISAPISRLPERTYPGDEISRI